MVACDKKKRRYQKSSFLCFFLFRQYSCLSEIVGAVFLVTFAVGSLAPTVDATLTKIIRAVWSVFGSAISASAGNEFGNEEDAHSDTLLVNE